MLYPQDDALDIHRPSSSACNLLKGPTVDALESALALLGGSCPLNLAS